MMILADCHEPEIIIEELKKNSDLKVIRLKYCDYSFSDVAIERKTLSDFFSSLKSGRLIGQMENIGMYYSSKFLIIEGFFDFSYIKNINYFHSVLLRITLDFDVKILFSLDEDSTADFIKRIYFRKNLNYIKEIKKDKIYHAAKFFGISIKKLKIVMSKFPNINSIVIADEKEFKSLKGIGKSTIKKVKLVLESDILK